LLPDFVVFGLTPSRDAADDVRLDDVGGQKVQPTTIQNRKHAESRLLARRGHGHQKATLNEKSSESGQSILVVAEGLPQSLEQQQRVRADVALRLVFELGRVELGKGIQLHILDVLLEKVAITLAQRQPGLLRQTLEYVPRFAEVLQQAFAYRSRSPMRQCR